MRVWATVVLLSIAAVSLAAWAWAISVVLTDMDEEENA